MRVQGNTWVFGVVVLLLFVTVVALLLHTASATDTQKTHTATGFVGFLLSTPSYASISRQRLLANVWCDQCQHEVTIPPL
jgi:hypothetical protein